MKASTGYELILLERSGPLLDPQYPLAQRVYGKLVTGSKSRIGSTLQLVITHRFERSIFTIIE